MREYLRKHSKKLIHFRLGRVIFHMEIIPKKG